jgi:NAD(P)-dependent dehydrogenase (short-subunit alcohol dehydrogenase family)
LLWAGAAREAAPHRRTSMNDDRSQTAPTAPTRAIVTGATSGIGRATALALARRGLTVGVTYRARQEAAEQLVAEIASLGGAAVAQRLDLADLDAVEGALEELIGRLGGVDVLVNNAGINRRQAAMRETLADWTRVLDVNLTGPWLCARTAARHMVGAGRGGRIVNVTSVLSSAALDGGGAYCAAKAGLEALTRVLALELAPHGIAVNSVAPGHTLTPMNFDDVDVAAHDIPRPVIPLARPAEASEIAAGIAFLASPQASYMTGSRLLIDGGLLAYSGPQALQEATGLPPSA